MSSAPKVHYLKDYQPPQFSIDNVYLEFELNPTATKVTNIMQISRLVSATTPLILDGESLTLFEVSLDGKLLSDDQFKVTDEALVIEEVPDQFELKVVTEVNPQDNTALEGLYLSSGNYCTQCEAESFRKITYYLDRPDVLSYFTTKVIAPIEQAKVLLSNGNLIDSGLMDDGRHYAVWEDPFKKPCYLFALVAGHLEVIEDHYVTVDGRKVALRVFVEPQNVDKCAHAMASLKEAMRWDEVRFGLVYDLDIYMIVAVDDFNMGAMENKGLNVFNSKYVLAKPETATDTDYEGIEAVIGHEYFHNWTGNRVTCRDWFQLTLKEGLTVFRDQEFTADRLSRGVKRIEDVKRLRTYQFPEDAGPLSHPIQPQSYIEMNNFYTVTVYEKGAEVVRLYHTLLGESGFRAGMDLYFERHDGEAVTVEDFRNAMADANDVDLSQMQAWYVQAGTPVVKVTEMFNEETQQYQLHCEQWLKGEQKHDPLLIPIRMGLMNQFGFAEEIQSFDANVLLEDEQEAILQMTALKQTFTFEGLSEKPIPVLLRDFSAPIILEFDYTPEALALIAQNDRDPFMRWEAVQKLALGCLMKNIENFQQGQVFELDETFAQSYGALLQQAKSAIEDKALDSVDMAFIALAMTLPDLTYVGEQYEVVDIEAIYETHHKLRIALAERYKAELLSVYQRLKAVEPEAYRYDKQDIAQRALKNRCLKDLMVLFKEEKVVKQAWQQYQAQNNMTDVLASLEALSHTPLEEREQALADFYQKWHHDPLVLDKWFALQAGSHHLHALEHVKVLVEHPDFSYTNPNRVRSVLGIFGRTNLMGFHRADGAGYAFLADQVIKLDRINPQVAARIVQPFTQWQRYDKGRREMMVNQLKRIHAQQDLSKDLYEVVSKSLQNAQAD